MVPRSVCPACAIREQAIWARDRFKGPDYSPLSPDATGGTVTRHAFVHHIEAGFHMLGVDTVSQTGSALAGEHSYRNGIAVYLASQRICILLPHFKPILLSCSAWIGLVLIGV